jgi:UDP:flavonoid glycosyltransferase YjiC (YdhE family)
VLDIRTVTAKKLANEINALYHSQPAREKARLIGAKVSMEDGVSRAVGLIEKTFG